MEERKQNFVITGGSFAAMIVGFLIGILLRKTASESSLQWLPVFDLFGKLWINILIFLVIPLAVSYMIYVLLTMMNTRILGRMGGYSLVVHLGILLAAMAFSVATGFIVVEFMGENLPKLTTAEITEEGFLNAENTGLIPIDRYNSILEDTQQILGRIILVLIFLSVVFCSVVSKLFKSFSHRLAIVAQAISGKSLTVLKKFLLSMPIAVFLLILPMAFRSGFTAVGVAGLFVIILSAMLVIFLLILYLLVYKLGANTLLEFSKGMVSSQIVAASTRSSLATIPTLMRDAEYKMGIPKEISAIIIPFFVSVFRLNRVISSPFQFIFLSYVFRLDFDVATFLLFLVAQIIISFGSPGIPSGGKYVNLPIYLAAGIPLEGYILLKAVDAIPDIFKTLLNVTEVMAVVSIVAKKAKWKPVISKEQNIIL